MVIAERTGPLARNNQWMQPVRASSACTAPLALPTKSVPFTTVGALNATTSPAKPYAHSSSSRRMSLARKPAASAPWNRALSPAGLHPDQLACMGSDMMFVSAAHDALEDRAV